MPRVGGGWGQCDPNEPRNRRLRSSILIESAGANLLVDCGPDRREQLLTADVSRVDGVLVTHDHADHCHGIDDLRPLAQSQKSPMPIHARQNVLDSLHHRFRYVFAGSGFYAEVAEPRPLPERLQVGDAGITFVDQPHGRITSVGMRIDEGGRSAVYAIDYQTMTDDMRALYAGADVWISDCLGRKPHPTHAHLEAVLAWARELSVGQLYLTHLNNSMDYQTLVRELPDWAAPAYDGLEINLQ